ncbi:hypothetical protein [Acetobacter fallax]|uniref:Uncharacterized protein n=1 Tax=Acetobacter fallax TaxID=1737473 RepID=A0ABX0KB57_9PROT|nr:hypothetical protein [Acetobacter fallax]NHO33391.1 hypothetical protein [Acetobacter fallax]NHO37010.1 hypothetical protein [Acetobacter fallax]
MADITDKKHDELIRRIELLETQVAELTGKLKEGNPKDNARKIRILSVIISALAGTIRELTRQIGRIRSPRQNRQSL